MTHVGPKEKRRFNAQPVREVDYHLDIDFVFWVSKVLLPGMTGALVAAVIDEQEVYRRVRDFVGRVTQLPTTLPALLPAVLPG